MRRMNGPQGRPFLLTNPRGVRRIGLMVILMAAAMPVRLSVSVPLVNSVSILDLLLIVGGFSLCLEAGRTHRINTGYPQLFRLLIVPLGMSIVSVTWSQDPGATLRSSLTYLESIVAYLYVVSETDGLQPTRVLTYMKRFTYLTILPAILLLLHVPGFEPDVALGITPDDYVSYYARLSHPVLGRSNNLATVIAFFVPPLLYWGRRYRDGRFARAGVVALVAVCLTLSRGVLLALAVSGLLYWLSSRGNGMAASGGRSVVWKLAAVSLIALAMIVMYEITPDTNGVFYDRLNGWTVDQRLRFFGVAIEKIMARPVLGYGAGVVPDGDPDLVFTAHNTYLQQVLSYGVPLGLLICIVLCQICIFFFSKERRHTVARVLGFSILGQLLVFMTETSFEGTILKVLFYISVGLSVGLLRSAESCGNATDSPGTEGETAMMASSGLSVSGAGRFRSV